MCCVAIEESMAILFRKFPISLGIQEVVSCMILDRHYSSSSCRIAWRGNNCVTAVEIVSSGPGQKGLYCSCFLAWDNQLICNSEHQMMIWYFSQPLKGAEVNLSLDLLDFLF